MWFEIDNKRYWVLDVSRGRFVDSPVGIVDCMEGPGCSVMFCRYIYINTRVDFPDEFGFFPGPGTVIRSFEEQDVIIRRLETELALEQLENL